jgi:hypothetical protein
MIRQSERGRTHKERYCSWGIAASVGGSILGGLISGSSARSAADTQSAASDRASANTMQMFNTVRGDLAPWAQTGRGANSMLANMLGIPTGSGTTWPYGSTDASGATGSSGGGVTQSSGGGYQWRGQTFPDQASLMQAMNQFAGDNLDAEAGGYQRTSLIQREMQNVQAVQGPTTSTTPITGGVVPGTGTTAGTGADYGVLSRQYQDWKPFTMTDLALDPSYNWRKQQGESSILNNMTALGGVNSGNTMRGLMDYGQGLASTEFGAARGRSLNDYLTNRGNFVDWQNQVYNMLSGVSGTGANAAGQTAGLGMNAANTVSNNMIGAGNAQAAGQVGFTNNLVGGINQGINNYMRYSGNELANLQNQYGAGNVYTPSGSSGSQAWLDPYWGAGGGYG